MKHFPTYHCILILFLFLTGCARDEKMFRIIPSSESGITFTNTLTEHVEFNIFNYMYFYNGGGVAVGDVNNDGLPDIYFTSNQQSNKLYLNEGDFRFKDVTEAAGTAGLDCWATGVTMADVNSDGRLDIYVSYVGDYLIYKGRNQLFINEGENENGVPVFRDRAAEFGLDLVGFSTQATFFDYDLDGDLDMFQLNHSLHQNGTFGKSNLRYENHPLAGDKFFKNENGKFVDVTKAVGIHSSVIGYGLGVVASDINLDGWPDIYVGNDFHENDYLYINQGDGTFREMLEQQMNHTSRYTMGVDFGDLNNDAFPDLIAMDMLPEDPFILKASAAEDPYDVYQFKVNFGYNHQFARNTLQLNNRNGTFSEIGVMAGVHATDWSWATLLADFNLDGRKDIYVANGILRRSNDLDYINFITLDSIQVKLEGTAIQGVSRFTEKMPKIKLPNYLFINNGDSTFTNTALSSGMEIPSYSNGSAYADLDNDGDLDLVVNNVQDEAFVIENRTRSKDRGAGANHFLQFVLKGQQGNVFGIGAKILVYDAGNLQVQECMPTRGYLSSVDYRLTFGTPNAGEVDSVVVIWPGGAFQKLTAVKTDQVLEIRQVDGGGRFDYRRFHRTAEPVFKHADLHIEYKHSENNLVEFHREALLPHMLSAEGPAAAIGDINSDGLEDIFLGGSKWQQGVVFIQTPSGTFIRTAQPAISADSLYEDVAAEFFDADGDTDQDLFIVGGGNEFGNKSPYASPRIYFNDGKGQFLKSSRSIPVFTTGSCVAVNDYDGDGDQDVFVGSRAVVNRYGVSPDSYLLENDGKGNFSDVTDRVAPALKKFGFVKDAVWVDVDNDMDDDLVIAAEWSPITIFINDSRKLSILALNGTGLENSNGWWNTIHPVDFDNDGDIDFIAGNLGLNSKLKASVDEPVKMYVSDFDKNDSTDQVLTHFMNGREYPFHTRDEMTKQMPSLKKRYLSYNKFARATAAEMFGAALDKSKQFVAYTFHSSLIENLGNNKFKVRPLPSAAQLSTINAILADDINGDGHVDLLLAGNFYRVNIQLGRYDASYGLLMLGDGKGNFKPVPVDESGFSVPGETRGLLKLVVGGKVLYLAVRNDDSVVIFERGAGAERTIPRIH